MTKRPVTEKKNYLLDSNWLNKDTAFKLKPQKSITVLLILKINWKC